MKKQRNEPAQSCKLIWMGAVVGLSWALNSTQVMAKTSDSVYDLPSIQEQTLSMTPTITATADSTTHAALGAGIIADIDAYLEAHYQTGRFSGTVMVTRGDEAVLTRTYGLANREHGVANTLETKFRIGSITKQFTAVAILQLQEQGLIDLQAPVVTYLPDYPEGKRITIHHLLTHTAGIPEYLDPETFPDIAEWMRLPATLDQLMARFKDLPLEFEPGEQFKYSNSGYILLTQILETVSGQTYADYMQTQIFEPLGMTHTGYEIPQAVISNLAQGYIFIGTDTHLKTVPMDMSLPQGAGGLYSTVEDLATWNQWLYGENLEQTVLSETAKATLTTPFAKMDGLEDSPDAFYGYGVVLDAHLERQRIHHSGGISGFLSVLAHYPDEALTISVLTNFSNQPPGPIADDLAAILFGAPYELPTQAEEIEVDPALYEKYVGTYQLLPDMQVTMRVEEGQLVGQATGQDSFVLYPSSEIDFFAKIVDVTVTFSLSEDGIVEGFTLRQLGQDLFAPKIDE
ncbi:MAG: serine hydrolase [Cyanobacteria bacterium J06635_1]